MQRGTQWQIVKPRVVDVNFVVLLLICLPQFRTSVSGIHALILLLEVPQVRLLVAVEGLRDCPRKIT